MLYYRKRYCENIYYQVLTFVENNYFLRSESGGSMISNQVLQSTIEGLKNIARIELCVLDVEGKAYAFTNQEMEKYSAQAVEFVR